MIKALITDLDNTIYPVTSIGDRLFAPLMDLLEEHKDEIGEENIQEIKKEIMKKPFQKIADKYGLKPELKQQGIELLSNLTYDRPMQTYDDYRIMQQVKAQKFLVTMGFTKMQQNKLDLLSLREDFQDAIVVDPELTDKTKLHAFKDIISKYDLKPEEVLIIGDDADSEIKAGNDLGMPTYLRDEIGEYPEGTATYQYPTLEHLTELFK
jgi:putative hydrolase of the HAD superfamily